MMLNLMDLQALIDQIILYFVIYFVLWYSGNCFIMTPKQKICPKYVLIIYNDSIALVYRRGISIS